MGGLFVVFEGIDKAGKSTQAKILQDDLDYALFKYPDRSTTLGRVIDRWLQGEVTLAKKTATGLEEDGDAPLALQGLLLANKVEALGVLQAAFAMNEGRVLCDRWSPSARAYGTADGLDDAWLKESHRCLPEPDLIFLIDITVREAMRRRHMMTGEHYENEARLVKAREKYLAMAREDERLWVVIDGMESKVNIAMKVKEAISKRLHETRPSAVSQHGG